VNRDPIGYEGGTLNLYEYAEGGPINFTDHLGLEVDTINQTIWQSILKGKWKNAADLIDDWLKCQFDPNKIRQLKALKHALKEIRAMGKWRKQMKKLSLKKKREQLKQMKKTLEKHFKVR